MAKSSKKQDDLAQMIDEAVEDIEKMPRLVSKGTLVKGNVVTVDPGGVVVDVGAKAEGLVPMREISRDELDDLNKGDEVLVYVISDEDDGGRLVLSIKRTEALRKWIELEKAKKEESPVRCVIREVNAGGVLVDIKGVSGFIPSSQLDPARIYKLFGTEDVDKEKFAKELPRHLGKLVGEELEAKVIEVDKDQNRVILSEKLVSTSLSVEKREKTLDKVKVGDVLDGVVTDVRPYGVFVNAEGLDGLVHISEISWDKVEDTSDFYSIGDKVKVMLIGIDEEGRRVAYSIKRLQEDPWDKAVKTYKVGQIIEGTVTKVVPYGAFVRLGEGLNGLVHISELSDDLVLDPKEIVKRGEDVKVMILSISPEERHLGLSLRRVESEGVKGSSEKEKPKKKPKKKASKKKAKKKTTKRAVKKTKKKSAQKK